MINLRFFSFEWDAHKESENISKHGVDFETAKLAFRDLDYVLMEDSNHSYEELRFFCIGKVNRKILTVRFTVRYNKIRIIGAGFWRRKEGESIMKKKTKMNYDDDFPSDEAVVIENFLPPPEQILFNDDPTRKVTITLNESIIDFFKREAEKHGSKYQRMIRILLMKYARLHDKNPPKPKLAPGEPWTKKEKEARLRRNKRISKKLRGE